MPFLLGKGAVGLDYIKINAGFFEFLAVEDTCEPAAFILKRFKFYLNTPLISVSLNFIS